MKPDSAKFEIKNSKNEALVTYYRNEKFSTAVNMRAHARRVRKAPSWDIRMARLFTMGPETLPTTRTFNALMLPERLVVPELFSNG